MRAKCSGILITERKQKGNFMVFTRTSRGSNKIVLNVFRKERQCRTFVKKNAHLSFVPDNENSGKRKINENQRRNGVFIDVDCMTYKKINSITVKVKKRYIHFLASLSVSQRVHPFFPWNSSFPSILFYSVCPSVIVDERPVYDGRMSFLHNSRVTSSGRPRSADRIVSKCYCYFFLKKKPVSQLIIMCTSVHGDRSVNAGR